MEINRSFLAKLLLFDGIATGLPCVVISALGYKVGPFIGIPTQYVTVKFGVIAVYGCSLAYSMLTRSNASRTQVIFAAAANIVFAAETLYAYSTGKLNGLTWLGKQMMGSLAVGGIIFPYLMWQGWLNQQAKIA